MPTRILVWSWMTLALAAKFSIGQTSLPAVKQQAPIAAARTNGAGPAVSGESVAIAQLQEEMRQRDAIIRNLLERVQELESRAGGAAVARDAMEKAPENPHRPQGSRPDGDPSSSASKSTAALTSTTSIIQNSGYDAEERKASEALDQALVTRGGLLLPPGTLEVDHSVSYFSSSSDHLTINGFALLPILVVGDITSQRSRRDFLLPTFTTRLGLPHRWQGEIQIPYGYQLNRSVAADGTSTVTSGFGLGDIQGAVSRQLTLEHGRVPDLLANVRFKGRTGVDGFQIGTSSDTALGSGFYGIQGNLTAVKASDPVVFFGNLSYTENLPAKHLVSANDPDHPDAKVVGHYRPGAAVGFQLGTVLALNPETSMTWGWDQRFTQVTKLNGAEVPASYLVEGTLRMGISYLFARGRTLDFGFGVGLTPDTPNLQFSFGLPIRMALWNRHPERKVH